MGRRFFFAIVAFSAALMLAVLHLRGRWRLEGKPKTAAAAQKPPPLHLFVMNLDSRPDRWELVSAELAKLDVEWAHDDAATVHLRRPHGQSSWCNTDHGARCFTAERVASTIGDPLNGTVETALHAFAIARDKQLPWFLLVEDDIEFGARSVEQFIDLLPTLWGRRHEWDAFSGAVSELSEVRMVDQQQGIVWVRGYGAQLILFQQQGSSFSLAHLRESALPTDVFYSQRLVTWTAVPYLAMQRPSYSNLLKEFVDYTAVFRFSEALLQSYVASWTPESPTVLMMKEGSRIYSDILHKEEELKLRAST